MNNELLQSSACLDLLLIATWRVLPLFLLVSLASFVFRRRLAAKYQVVLWSLVVVRLMLPFSLPNPWSMHGPVDQLVTFALQLRAGDARPGPARYSASIKSSGELPALLSMPVLSHDLPQHGQPWKRLWPTAIVAIWALVAAWRITHSGAAHLRFAWHLRRCSEFDDPRLTEMVLRECDALGVLRRPKVKELPELATPAVFGLFQSTICLPVGSLESLSPPELRWVLRHELAHVRRCDAWLLTFASVVRSLHWFNPIAWLATSRLRSHIELAADDLALRESSSSDAIAYGRLLLRYVDSALPARHSAAIRLLSFVSGSRLRERIERLARDRSPQRRWARGLIGFAMLMLAFASLTDAAPPAESTPSSSRFPEAKLGIEPSVDRDEGATSLRTYDVAEVLERIREMNPGDDPELVLMALYPGMRPNPKMRLEQGHLIAELTERRHHELANALAAWRIGGPRQICIEFRVVQATLSLVSGIDWTSTKVNLEQHGSRPIVGTRIREDQLRHVIQNMSSDRAASFVFAPKVTVFNGQTAMVSSMVQRPFVTSVEPRQDGSLHPVVTAYDDGFKITLRPATTADGSLDLAFDLQTSTIGEVNLASLPFRHPEAPYPHVKVQVPSVITTSARSTVRLPATESVLLAAPQVVHSKSSEAPARAMFYILTPRVLHQSELVAASAPAY